MDRAALWALGSAVFAALAAIFAKLGVAALPSDVAALLRAVLIVPILALVVAATCQWPRSLDATPRDWASPSLSAMGAGLSWLRYFRALKAGDGSRVAPIDKFSSVLVVAFGVAFPGKTLDAKAIAAIAMISGGVILLAL